MLYVSYLITMKKFIKNSVVKGKLKGINIIENSRIEEGVEIISSHIFDSVVGENTKIGPNAHLRPNSKIGKNCRIGNFVEIKNSVVGDNTKIAHLTYVGDAKIGKGCNIGCGVVFVNYNGKEKNEIVIGNNVFIGSNCNLIAPLNIPDNVYICAGTTVTQNLNEYDFVIGRSREVIKPNRAIKYLKEIK